MSSPDLRKTVLITGAGIGGIGGSLATTFLSSGWRVFAGVRRLPTAPPGTEAIHLDVTSTPSISAAVTQITSLTAGKLDMLINNAGLAIHAPVTDLDVDGAVKDMFDVNLFGVMKMVSAFSPLLVAAGGVVVNIGSVAPILPLVYSAGYNAAKAALHAYGDSARIELAPFGVQVVTVVTGGVKSNIVRVDKPELPEGSMFEPVKEFFLKRAGVSQEGAMDTDEYARGVVKAVTKRRLPEMVWYGHFARQSWWLWMFSPRAFRDWILSRMFGLNKLAVIVRERREREMEDSKRK